MGSFHKQLKMEFETVQANLEYVFAGPQTKTFLLIEQILRSMLSQNLDWTVQNPMNKKTFFPGPI